MTADEKTGLGCAAGIGILILCAGIGALYSIGHAMIAFGAAVFLMAALPAWMDIRERLRAKK